MQIHENTIETAINKKCLNALAFYCHAKKCVSNSRYYGSTPKKALKRLSDLTNISPKACKKYVNQLHEMGLVRLDGTHITFISQDKQRRLYAYRKSDYHFCTVKFEKGTKLKDIKRKLYTKIVEKLARQQEYAIESKQRLTGNKKAENLQENIVFTDAKLTNELGISKGSVQRLKRYMVMDNKFKLIIRKPKAIRPITPEVFNASKEVLKQRYGNVFFHRDRNNRTFLYQSFPTVYIPVK